MVVGRNMAVEIDMIRTCGLRVLLTVAVGSDV